MRWIPVFLALAAALAHAAEFHTPVSINSVNSTAFYPIDRLIQGPGTGFAETPPHDAIPGSNQTWVTDQTNGNGNYYANGVPAPVLVIDLGEDTRLAEISTWGYSATNANGVRTFDLRFATAAEGPAGCGNSIPAQVGFIAAASDATRDSHPLVPVIARYVEFTATGNWRNYMPHGGDRVGLGEISFENVGPVSDPRLETATALDLDFDGSLQSFGLDLHNAGVTQNLTVVSATFGGPQAGAFSIIGTPPGIAPGNTATLEFSFNPTGLAGAVAATLNLTTNDALVLAVSIPLAGFLHDPKLVVAGTLDFGIIAPGSPPAAKSLPLRNDGAGHALVISSATLSGPNAASFAIVSPPANVPPSGPGEISVTCNPAPATGYLTAQLTLATNDAANPLTVVNLQVRVATVETTPQVRINEFLASNDTGLKDGDGNRPDWIELFNSGETDVDLAGWHLTDRANKPTQWTFPSVTIEAGKYLVVFASGQASGNYVDAGGNLHTNFSLAAGGEYLGLIRPDGVTIASEFAPKYPPQFADVSYGALQDTGSETNAIAASVPNLEVPADGSDGLAWTFRTFTPGPAWFAGTGQGIGYDLAADYAPFITTDVKAALYDAGKPGIYIRFPFTVADRTAVTALRLHVRYDDGFAAYLNGTAIAARNAPGAPRWDSLATGSSNPEPGEETIDVSAFIGDLQNGDNVLAIHGLNNATNSSDFLVTAELLVTTPGPPTAGNGWLPVPTPGARNSAAANPGPAIAAVTPQPADPQAGQPTTITAAVSPRLAPVDAVTLHYRVAYGSETAVPMTDDGVAPDLTANDGIFSAAIPASAHTAGEMLRWAVTASDTAANAARAPAFLDSVGDSQSPEYYGTVIPDPGLASGLPVFQWFTPNVSASHTRAGARASVAFRGRFYDNVFVRQRGGATNGSSSQKFDFNKGETFYIDQTMPAVGEINLNGNGSDGTYVRQPLAFQTYRDTGHAACQCALWQMRVNNSSDRTGVFVEQVDDSFLTRNGYDPEGELYKVTGYQLAPSLSTDLGGFEKKTADREDVTSFSSLVAGLNQPTAAARRSYIFDSLDVPQILNYLALRSITQDADDVRKNYYLYQDARGDQRWRIFPWDKDWTFGITGDGGTWLPHPFFGDHNHAKQNANQWNVLYDDMFGDILTQRLYLRRLRTLMDTVLASPISENRAAIIAPASPPLSSNLSSINNYLISRRNVLANNYPDLIPASQPANPAVAITNAEFNPASGNQDHEYIQIHNSETTEIDISGWTLAGAVGFTFPPGTVISRGGELTISPDTLAFRQRPTSPTGGEDRIVVGPYTGHLSNFGETITLANPLGTTVSNYNTPVAPTDAQRYLVISEIMYHPNPDGDAEFIELMNISDSVTLDLAGVSFTQGILFTFPPATSLPPGGRVVVVKNETSFRTAYGPAIPIAGIFDSPTSLDNGGEFLKLDDATGSTIAGFAYDDMSPWPVQADGAGSLVLIAPRTHLDPALPQNWRVSITPAGSPGTDDAIHFTGDPQADANNNSRPDLVDYALGANAHPQFRFVENSVLLDVPYIANADDAIVTAEYSTDLTHWTPGDFVQDNGALRTFSPPAAMTGGIRVFARAAVRLR